MTQRFDIQRAAGATRRRPRASWRGWLRRLPRVAAALVAAGAVGAGVTACQAQPGAAAFLDGHRYTQGQVEDVLDAFRADAHGQVLHTATVRQSIARDLVMRDLAKRVAADRHITLPKPDYSKVAKQNGIPESDPFLRLDIQTGAYIDRLREKLGVRAKATSADYRDIYRSLVAGGLDTKQFPYRAARSQIAKIVDPKAIRLRRVLQDAADRYDARLNPRYGDPAYPISSGVRAGSISGTLPVRLGDPSPDVVVSPTSADPLSQG